MSSETSEALVLNRALQQVIRAAATADDPVMAGGVCILYKSRMMEMLSVETSDMEFGTLNALIAEELDSTVKSLLQKSLGFATKAQQTRLSPLNKLLN